MSHFKLLTTLFSAFVMTAFVWAAEPNESLDEPQALPQERALLQESERIEHPRPDEHDPRIVQLRQTLAEWGEIKRELEGNSDVRALLELVRDAAKGVEIELRLSSDHHHEHPRPHREPAERLEHMRIAVDHLQRAGLHDIAEQVARRADAAEREMHERQRHHVEDAMHNIMKELDELRHEVHRLRDEVSELKKNR